jgi:hypothetical protein
LLINEGAVVFLNGQEVYRTNTTPGPITVSTQATVPVSSPTCLTNLSVAVTNLLPGTNWLAIAVSQSIGWIIDGDPCFAMELAVQYPRKPVVPEEPVPALALSGAPQGDFELSWAAGGYALENATNVENSLSYPRGPWMEVSNMANPFLFRPANRPAEFFRLRRKCGATPARDQNARGLAHCMTTRDRGWIWLPPAFGALSRLGSVHHAATHHRQSTPRRT